MVFRYYDLPTELRREIVESICNAFHFSWRRELRLVSKEFNEFSSPYLFSSLTLPRFIPAIVANIPGAIRVGFGDFLEYWHENYPIHTLGKFVNILKIVIDNRDEYTIDEDGLEFTSKSIELLSRAIQTLRSFKVKAMSLKLSFELDLSGVVDLIRLVVEAAFSLPEITSFQLYDLNVISNDFGIDYRLYKLIFTSLGSSIVRVDFDAYNCSFLAEIVDALSSAENLKSLILEKSGSSLDSSFKNFTWPKKLEYFQLICRCRDEDEELNPEELHFILSQFSHTLKSVSLKLSKLVTNFPWETIEPIEFSNLQLVKVQVIDFPDGKFESETAHFLAMLFSLAPIKVIYIDYFFPELEGVWLRSLEGETVNGGALREIITMKSNRTGWKELKCLQVDHKLKALMDKSQGGIVANDLRQLGVHVMEITGASWYD